MSIFDTILSSLRSLVGGGTTAESDTSGTKTTDSGGQVSVERERESNRESADASTEAAVKGTDPEADSDDDAVAAGTDAAASTGTLVDEAAGTEPAEAVVSPGESDAEESGVPDDAGESAEADEADAVEADEAESAEADEADAVEADGAESAEADEADAVEAADGTSTSEESGAAEASETADAEVADDESEAASEDDEGEASDEADAEAVDDDRAVDVIKGIGPAYASRLEEFGIETVGGLAAADATDVAEGIDVSESRVSGWIDRAHDEA